MGAKNGNRTVVRTWRKDSDEPAVLASREVIHDLIANLDPKTDELPVVPLQRVDGSPRALEAAPVRDSAPARDTAPVPETEQARADSQLGGAALFADPKRATRRVRPRLEHAPCAPCGACVGHPDLHADWHRYMDPLVGRCLPWGAAVIGDNCTATCGICGTCVRDTAMHRQWHERFDER